jgi:putative ABC transport system substrate-binding protein
MRSGERTTKKIGLGFVRCALLLKVLVALLVCRVDVLAQSAGKIPRIGYLGSTNSEGTDIQEFRRGLRDLGYIDGKNILIEPRYRYGDGTQDRSASFVEELVRLKVDIFVSPVGPAIVAAKKATSSIPIVMVSNVDPVATGIIESLARPGGNITGVASLTRELGGKRLELLKEVVPRVSRVGVIWSTTPGLGFRTGFQSYEAAARALKIPLQSLEVCSPNPDFEGAFRDAAKARADALITSRNSLLSRHRKQITELALKNRLPSMFEGSSYVEAGGLMSYSVNDADQHRRAAIYVDKILKGAKPADLPVEQASKFELVINLKTAKQIGLTIPPDVLARANKVIR